LTNRCNLSCAHCMRRRDIPASDLDLEFLESVLRQAKEFGIQRVTFTGGEPFMHPRWQEAVEKLAEMGFIFSIVTNGILLNKVAPFLVRPAIRRNLQHISVSLDGTTEDVNDEIRGRGSYRKTMKGILAAHARGIPMVLKFTMNRKNFSQIEEVVFSASKLGMERVEFAHMHPTPENIKAGLSLTPDEWKYAEARIKKLFDAMKMGVFLSAGHYDQNAFSLCAHLTINELYVDARGYLSVCCMLPAIRGMDPDAPEKDLAADLHQVSLSEGLNRLVDIVSEYHHDRINRISRGEVGEFEHFQCMACAKYFDKIKWIEGFPDNPWARLYAASLEGKDED
jgi:MoaA/NifB/PqqE/SkfB family radical SAM enzyme